MTQFDVVGESVEWEGRIIRAGHETYRFKDGTEYSFDKVWHAGAVTIIPYDDTHVWLVRQPRWASRLQASLEIPAGKRDREGEPPLDLAKRELIEEVGKEAAEWRELPGFYPAPGYCDEYINVFAATGLSDAAGGAVPDADEHIEIVPWPLDDLEGALAATNDGKTMVGLMWLSRELERQ